ncbi:MAG: hypothetical protein K9L24_03735 [Spirochaetia bacterium]|nr:hypothetical protein [Spirochaetia bacterium]
MRLLSISSFFKATISLALSPVVIASRLPILERSSLQGIEKICLTSDCVRMSRFFEGPENFFKPSAGFALRMPCSAAHERAIVPADKTALTVAGANDFLRNS